MTLDIESIKRRRNIMMGVCLVATLVAIASMTLYLRGQDWAVAGFIVAVASGSGARYFIAAAMGAHGDVTSITYEHGTAFTISAGLMNLLLMLDAYDISEGHKE